jgi:uncharacterized alkaline shock family protein YloU
VSCHLTFTKINEDPYLGRTAVVDLAIAVQYGTQLGAIAREVQQRAIAELRAKTGLHDVTVNVTIDDVIT